MIDIEERAITEAEFNDIRNAKEDINGKEDRSPIALAFLILLVALPLAFIVGTIMCNKYVCGISAAMIPLLIQFRANGKYDNTSPEYVTNKFCAPVTRLHLNISWVFVRALSLILTLFLLRAFSRFRFSDEYEENLPGIFWIIAGAVLILIAGIFLFSRINIALKRYAVKKHGERCSFAVNAVGLTDGEEKMRFRGRRVYRYTFSGMNYILFDQGEDTFEDDMMILIDPSEPEYYYEETWTMRIK